MPAQVRRQYAPRVGAARRREQLLDAALHLAATEGISSVTMEGVARGAGVTKPVVYELFPQRGALYEALIEREELRALQQLRAIVPPEIGALTAADLVATSIRALVSAVHERPDAWTVLLQAPESMPPNMRARYEQRRAELVQGVRALIAAGRRAGRHDSVLDEQLMAESLVAMGELAGRLALRKPGEFTPDRLAEFCGQVTAHLLPTQASS